MKQSFLSELFLYRYRYLIGYALVALLTIGLLTLRISDIPPGYDIAEQNAAVASYNLEFKPDINFVDLPYHLLQKASLKVFGLTEIGIRLPSILVAGATALGILLLFRRWFADNIAIMASIVAVISAPFLLQGRAGTAAIMVSLWAIWILLFATLISQATKLKSLYKLLLIATIGISLYTPYMVYLLVAAGLATIVHPHLRYTLRTADKVTIVISAFLCGIVIAPLGWYLYQHPFTWHELVGIPADLPTLWQYLSQLGTTFMAVAVFFKPPTDDIFVPFLSIPTLAIFLIGVGQTIRDYYSNRSHLLLIWTAILLPVVAFDPARQSALFVPIIIFTAIGLSTLVRMWYSLFPRNPYARLFGLLPIAALLVSIVHFNYNRYFVGLNHSPNVVNYNNDARLMHEAISTLKLRDKQVTIVAPEANLAFYRIETEDTKQLATITKAGLPTAVGTLIIAESEYQLLDPAQKASFPHVSRLIVNDRVKDALRWRVFIR